LTPGTRKGGKSKNHYKKVKQMRGKYEEWGT